MVVSDRGHSLAGGVAVLVVTAMRGAHRALFPSNGREAVEVAALAGILALAALGPVVLAALAAQLPAAVALAVLAAVALLRHPITLAVAVAVLAFTVKGPTGRCLLPLVTAVVADLAVLLVWVHPPAEVRVGHAAAVVAAVLMGLVAVQDGPVLSVSSGLALVAAHLHSHQLT